MAAVQERLKVMRQMLDPWSTREKLMLATAVLRSGDQNWSSVSRSVKPYATAKRPPDWFSPKNCALQYTVLLESVDTPKRKKRVAGSTEKNEVETPVECLVRKLTEQRVEELRKEMSQVRSEYSIDAQDLSDLISGKLSEQGVSAKLQEIELHETREKDDEEAYERFLVEREERRKEFERTWRPNTQLHLFRRQSSVSEASSEADSPLNEPLNVEVVEEAAKNTPTSPLLTSLLKSPSTSSSSILHSAITSPLRGSSPTIANLLGSPTVSQLSMPSPTVSPNLKNLVSSAIAAANEEPKPVSTSPSQGAPTLSMLLELPPSLPGKPLPVLQPAPSAVVVPAPPPYSEHLRPPPPYALAAEYLQKQKAEQLAKQQEQLMLQPINLEEPKDIQEKLEITETVQLIDDAEIVQEILEEVSKVEETDLNLKLDDLIKKSPSPQKSLIDVKINLENSSEKFDDLALRITPHKKPSSSPKIVDFEQVREEVTPRKDIITVSDDHNYVEKTPEKKLDRPQIDVFEFDEMTESQNHLSDSNLSYLKRSSMRRTSRVSNENQEEVKLIEIEEEVIAEEEKETNTEEIKIVDIEDDAENDKTDDDRDGKIEQLQLSMPVVSLEKIDKTEISTTEDERSNDGVSGNLRKRKQRLTTSLSASDSVPGSPNSSTEDEKELKVWKKSVLLILSRLMSHKSSSLFLKPVKDDDADDYSSIVKRPMDLTTIKKNIEGGNIRTTAEVQRDVMLMFRNAIMFNKKNSVVYQMTLEMERESLDQFQVLRQATSTESQQPSRRETRTNPQPNLAQEKRKNTRTNLNEKRKRSSNTSDFARKKLKIC